MSGRTVCLFIICGDLHDRDSEGIYAFRFMESDGNLDPLGLAARAINPSCLAAVPSISPYTKAGGLLSVGETSEGIDGWRGKFVSYAVDPTCGILQIVDRVPSHGDWPCSFTLDETGRYVFVANFWGGTVVVIPHNCRPSCRDC